MPNNARFLKNRFSFMDWTLLKHNTGRTKILRMAWRRKLREWGSDEKFLLLAFPPPLFSCSQKNLHYKMHVYCAIWIQFFPFFPRNNIKFKSKGLSRICKAIKFKIVRFWNFSAFSSSFLSLRKENPSWIMKNEEKNKVFKNMYFLIWLQIFF